METEDFAERISKFFESPQLAFYRLDSISYFASESGFNDRTVRSHLKNIARISLERLKLKFPKESKPGKKTQPKTQKTDK